MYPISNAFLTAVKTNTRKYYCTGWITTKGGVVYEFDQDAIVTLSYHLQVAGGSYEKVPMGIFEVSEANRKAKCLEIKTYDYTVRFEKAFNGFEAIGNAFVL